MSLFSERSILTMAHGILFGGGALLAIAAAIFALWQERMGSGREAPDDPAVTRRARGLKQLGYAIAAVLWLAVLSGTYVVFPPYRTPPPEGTTDLSAYPRAVITSNPETAWLHGFGMESKEHMPWIAAIVATGAAVAIARSRPRTSAGGHQGIRSMAMSLLMISFVLVSWISLLGVFVNKVAPLE
jgi:hypothetical protein